MKIQLEQIDLLQPWPRVTMREGYHAIHLLVRLGNLPIGDIAFRPMRRRSVTHQRLQRHILRKLGPAVRDAVKETISTDSDAHAIELSDLLSPAGIPAPLRERIIAAQSQQTWPMPGLTVAVCTRDRGDILEACIRHLQENDYPNFEIVVVDNSLDAVPTREVAEKLGVGYVRCQKSGLSGARNAAIAQSRHAWIAFIDDDCRPDPNWLRELVRPLQDSNCRCVCGLARPARLENIAQITFERYFGHGRGYAPRVFGPAFFAASMFHPAETWRIGTGANMLLHRAVAEALGGFDLELGASPRSPSGCGEDIDLFYRILRAGYSIHYTPGAIVRHDHPSTARVLRRQVYSYAIGRAAYHARCAVRYRDYRSLLQLVWHLPIAFVSQLRDSFSGTSRYPLPLLFLEVRGAALGPFQYTAAKSRRFWNSWFGKRSLAPAVIALRQKPSAIVSSPSKSSESRASTYGTVSGSHTPRAA
jgi:glycosyltransferase involved in cell wall biosynthesis